MDNEEVEEKLKSLLKDISGRVAIKREKYNDKFDLKFNLIQFQKIKSKYKKRPEKDNVESVALNSYQVYFKPYNNYSILLLINFYCKKEYFL